MWSTARRNGFKMKRVGHLSQLKQCVERCQALFLAVSFSTGVSAGVLPEGTPGSPRTVSEIEIQTGPESSPTLAEDLDVPFTDLRIGEVLSLDEVSRIAVARSLDINVFRLDREIKHQELPIAKSVYDTELTIEGDYEINETQPASTIAGSRTVTGGVSTTVERLLPTGTELTLSHSASRESTQSPFASLSRFYEGSAEIAVTQPVLRNSFGLIDRAKVQRVKLDVVRFDHQTSDRIEGQVFGVRTAYWDLVFAHRNVASKRRALRQAQEFLRTTQEKLVFGLVERQDAYAAEANVRLRVVDVLEAQVELENGRETVQVLLDLPAQFQLVPSTAPEFEEVVVDVEESLRRARNNRRDLRQLALELEIGDLTVRMKRSGLLPQLDLEASYRSSGLDRDLFDAQGEIGGFNHPTLFTGFTFSQPLENRQAEAKYRQAKLARERVRLKMRQLERDIDRKIREAVRELRLAAARVRQTQQAEVLQRNKLIEEGKAFQFGRSDSRTIIDFQEDLISAETQAQQALVAYRKAQDVLLRTEHRLLEARGLTGP